MGYCAHFSSWILSEKYVFGRMAKNSGPIQAVFRLHLGQRIRHRGERAFQEFPSIVASINLYKEL